MNEGTETVAAFDDLEINGSTGNEQEAAIPDGTRVVGRLIAWRTVDKPDWKQQREREGNIRNNKPDKEIDPQQWEIGFTIIGGDFDGLTVGDYVNRAWGERANASKYAMALLGKTQYDEAASGNIKDLAGRECSLFVVARKGRNYLDANRCEPVTQSRAPRTPSASKPAGDPQLVRVRELQDELDWSAAQVTAQIKMMFGEDAEYKTLTQADRNTLVAQMEDMASDLPF